MYEQNVTLGPGTGTFTQHTLEILIMLLGAFLLGIWLGWAMWSKYKQQVEKLTLENQSLTVTTEALRTEISAVKTRLATAETDNNNLTSQTVSLNRNNSNLRDRITELELELAAVQASNRQLDTELALASEPDTPVPDTFPLEVLSSSNGEQTQEKPAEPVVEAAEPEVLLAENSPAPLVIEPVPMPDPLTEKKKPATKKADTDKTDINVVAAAAGTSEDLTVVEGIGPKIQMLLNQYGIYTYRELAETEVDRLKEILSTAGPQLAMHDPGTWPSQANLAANDQWDTLKSVQGFLKGGKKPN